MGYRIRPLTAAMAVAFSTSAIWQSAAAQERQITTPMLNDVVVSDSKIRPIPTANVVNTNNLAPMRAATSDTASLLRDVPGVTLYGAGGTSSLPSIHGLADDRLRIKVDGMDLIASCPNHMNPPLSYLDPTNVGMLKVYAGITPVSVGGDSIGGTIIANSPATNFAAPGQGVLTTGEIGGFYRSNGDAYGGNLAATLATENLSLTYTASSAQSDNYKAAGDFKNFDATGRPGQTLPRNEVGSSAYETRNQTLGFAMKGGNHLVEAKFGYQDVPYQLYPNQRMDMLGNTQKRFNLRYLGQFDWGSLEARAYYERVDHYMNFGPDRQFQYGTAPGMPMNTKGKTTGATIKAEINLTEQSLLRLGGEYLHYTLNDWWPPSGTGGMAPYDFLNVNNGKRDRAALFGEWEKQLSPQWLTLLGVRYERVTTEAGLVHGYNTNTYPTVGGMSMMNQTNDAAKFNTSADRDQTDNNWDMTALARYKADATKDIEFGFARKVRSPNLYERYAWSTAGMMTIMNNLVGDGNGYVGNPDLKAEKAHTLSATFDWHATDRNWELKATPFYTRVNDYVDAIRCKSGACTAANSTATNEFVVLQYTNQSAELYGLDISGRVPLAKTGVGEFGFKGLLNYTHGKNRDTGGGLYNIMPINTKLALTHEIGGWNSALELVAAMGKDDVSDVRNEIKTAGYGLTNLRTSYTWKQVRVDLGIENLFDKFYTLPLGGAYVGQGTTMGINSVPWGIGVPGMGRSIYAGFNLKF